MPTTFLADLDLVSSTHTLAELVGLVGHPPGPGSHDRGEPRAPGRAWEQTIWRLSSTAGDEASLEEHLSQLRHQAEEIGLLEPSKAPGGVRRVLNLAVMSDAVGCTVLLPAAILLPFLAAGFDLEVTVYPVSEDG